MDIYMGGEGGVAETTVDVEELEETVVLQADVSNSKAEAPVLIDRVIPDGDDQGHKDAIAEHFDSKEAVDHFMEAYLRREYFSKRRDPHRDGRGGSGFYKVPAAVRQQAGTEAGFLYDPKHVNFRKISDLLQQQTEEAQRQISHYSYHLYWCAGKGERKKIDSFTKGLDDYQKSVNKKYKDLDPEERKLLWVDPPVSKDPQSLGLLFAVGFIEDLFFRSFHGNLSALEDPECAHSRAPDLWSDLLLLENQIPLFKIACGNSSDLSQLLFWMGSYFFDHIPLNTIKYFRLADEIKGGEEYLHVLHLVHDMLLPNDEYTIGKFSCSCWGFLWSKIRRLSGEEGEEEAEQSWRVQHIPTVTRLVSAGVQFKPVDEQGFVVEFKRGVLELPRLHVSKSTKKVMANLIAWEMCHADAPNYFINYAIFMDRLINTTKDVEILIDSKVLEHSLATDDEVKTFFDWLGQGLAYTKPEKHHKRYDIFPKLTEDIYKYCQSRRNKWMANLMQEYFKSPWTVISFIAALFLILLTTVQTFYAVYPYARPH